MVLTLLLLSNVPPPPLLLWNGFYVGLNAGGTFDNNSSGGGGGTKTGGALRLGRSAAKAEPERTPTSAAATESLTFINTSLLGCPAAAAVLTSDD